LTLAGTLAIRRADIRLPKSLPPTVATLDVRLAGAPLVPAKKPAPAVSARVGLALAVSGPHALFLHGRGVFAQLGGAVRLAGSLAAPAATGRFTLDRGEITFAGRSVRFTSGTVRFTGGVPIDPALDLVAGTTAAGVTATLTLSGTARHPKFTLASQPPLPSDEVLATLLFRKSTTQLSPLQIAALAAALAQLGGAPAALADPLATLRRGLGLDRLGIGTGANGTSPQVQAGRYIGHGIYLGAAQSTGGGGTSGQVQIDLGHGLKLDTRAGINGAGNAVGLTFEHQY
ncbi:MAG: translocation/assembly module TamB domain-containing protein, partial [Acetobacteraceae bacterium]